MRRIFALLTAALVAVFSCPLPAAADDPPTRSDRWAAIAQRALDRYEAIEGGCEQGKYSSH